MALPNSTFKDAAILIFKKSDLDTFTSGAGLSTSSTTFVDAITPLSFTPPSTGDYLIIGWGALQKDVFTTPCNAQLVVDGTAYGTAGFEMIDATHKRPWATMVKLNLNTTAHSISIQVKATTTGTATLNNPRIIVLRWDAFENAYYAESLSASTTTSATYQDKTTLTQTVITGSHDHSVLFSGNFSKQINNTAGAIKSLDDSTIQQESDPLRCNLAAKGDCFPFISLANDTIDGVSKTWKTQFKSNDGFTVQIQDSAIAALQMDGTSVQILGNTNIYGGTTIL